MPDSISINAARVKKEDLDSREVSVIPSPRLSIGHSEALGVKLFATGGLVSVYYQNTFYCLPTKDGQRDAVSVLSERIKDIGEIKENKIRFSDLGPVVRERLLIELFRHAATRASYFAIYDRIFFKADQNIDLFFTPSFELSVKEFQDSYGYFINPTTISMANCTRLFDSLRDGDRLIRLCSKRFECSQFIEEGRCKYSFPSYIGLLSGQKNKETEDFSDELENIGYEECPGIEDDDFGIIYFKRTRDAKTELGMPSFLAFRELTRGERSSFNIEEEFRKKLLPPSSVRYLQAKSILESVFKKDSITVNDLNLPINIELGKFQELSTGPTAGLEEPLLQFDPINEELCSIEPSSLFFKGVYDASSATRPFGAIRPYVIIRRENRTGMDQLLQWLSNCKTYTDRYGREKVDFAGPNHRYSKFNCRFILPREEDYFYADPNADFIECATTVLNQWKEENDRIVLIVLPTSVYSEEEEGRYGEYSKPYSLYYQLKKIFVENGIPCQMIEESTFSRIDKYVLQNLLVNIYSKMGGRPWSLHSPLSDVNAFIGIGFGLNPREAQNHVYIGVANIFDRHGEWLDICSDHKDITEEERESFHGYDAFTERAASYKLSKEMAQKITEESIKRFRDINPQIGFPRNVVIHKNGRLYTCEIDGIMEGLKTLEKIGAAFEKIGILSIIQDHNYKLFGNEESFEKGTRLIKDRPPKRGAVYFLEKNEALLCTTGKFYGERFGAMKLIYSGLGTPRPLLLKNHDIEPKDYGMTELKPYPFIELINQVFGLSKIHWGSLRTDIHLPVTSLYSSRVAKVISKSGIERIHKPAAKRPWFL
jgi:hypothetical protein